MPYNLNISRENILRLQKHSESESPREAVALIFGNIIDNDVFAKRIELLENESQDDNVSFLVNPEVQYRLLIEADNCGESMVGIFHSHPAPPYPSQSDIKNMKINPVVWIIASKTSGEWVMKAYILENTKPLEISIQYHA